MSFKIESGFLAEYTSPRICKVIQLPDKYVMSGVRLPHVMKDQSRPPVGSIVLVVSQDSFRSYLLAVLREPTQTSTNSLDPDFVLSTVDQMRGALPVGQGELYPGEVFIQASGTKDSGLTDNAYLYLGQNGAIELTSSSGLESLFIGGTQSVDDHSIEARSQNVLLRSVVETGIGVQSSVGFDGLNNLFIRNGTVTIGSSLTEVPVSELTMDILGDITLRNTTLGADKGVLRINTTGDILLKNTLGTYHADPAGNLSLTGPTINLNQGVLGAARLTDLTVSNITVDTAYWQYWQTLSAQIAVLPTTPLDGGAALKAGLAALFALVPLVLTSKISTASSTVTVGN